LPNYVVDVESVKLFKNLVRQGYIFKARPRSVSGMYPWRCSCCRTCNLQSVPD